MAILFATPATALAASCSAQTQALDFGNYDPKAILPNVSSSGYVEMKCTCSGVLDCVAIGYSISIPAGGSGGAARTMTRESGTETLGYGLYRDVAALLPWDTGLNAVGGTYTVLSMGSWVRTYVTGKIPTGQVVRGGDYKDTPSVVITY